MTEEQTNIDTGVTEAPVPVPETVVEPRPKPGAVPGVVWGTGRRKSSVARVRVKPGTGRILVNGREYKEFFPSIQFQKAVLAPLVATNVEEQYDVLASIRGGGLTGQSGALSLGIARALKQIDASFEETLREKHLLTRDPRMKERKKYGLHGARRGVQFSKR